MLMFWNLKVQEYHILKSRETWKGAQQPHLFKDTTKAEVIKILKVGKQESISGYLVPGEQNENGLPPGRDKVHGKSPQA